MERIKVVENEWISERGEKVGGDENKEDMRRNSTETRRDELDLFSRLSLLSTNSR
jgi:hypothetical protein